jgi:hypothetical protein
VAGYPEIYAHPVDVTGCGDPQGWAGARASLGWRGRMGMRP